MIAYGKRKQIIFPQQNITVKEVKSKKIWSYFQDGQKILEVDYTYNKDTRMYKIAAKAAKNSEIAQSTLQICLGRFDKYVCMHDAPWHYYMNSLASVAGAALIVLILV